MSAQEIWVEDDRAYAALTLVEPPIKAAAVVTARGQGVKRLFDITFAVLVMIAGLPLFLTLVAMVAATSPGPILFAHERVGRGGRRFPCLKFRTMQVDAAERLESLLDADPLARAEFELTYKLKNDPRITPFGCFLRATSLDELPQFWNVLRGDMSVVGPRPVVPEELPRYGPHASAYLALRPGLTGPWQVSGRNDVSYEQRVWLDAQYARHGDMRQDLEIVWRTVGVMTRRAGAY